MPLPTERHQFQEWKGLRNAEQTEGEWRTQWESSRKFKVML